MVGTDRRGTRAWWHRVARFLRVGAPPLVAALACARIAPPPPLSPAGLADAHTHLSYAGEGALDSLAAHGITAVRDCGGDLAELARWRAEVAAGRRRGPRLYLAGPALDGPKPGARYRVTVRTPEEAERVVDSLATLGVDFIKTHNAIPPDAFFAVLRRARLRHLRVAAHLPRGVPAWVAADSGVGSIEHMAESMLASPVYAGVASDTYAAVRWWRSPAGDSMILHLARTGVTVTPTLVHYRATIDGASTPELREARRALLPELFALTRRLHAAGVPLLAGSDFTSQDAGEVPGASLEEELALLERAGLTRAEARAAGGAAALERWFRGGR